ncbi:tetratricopeptide repeat protein [Saccharibacillus sp. CPCC 101409]|uniref:tetratricopeptide repeat protein n=1 Tax=Saccharibacillus sp. CPCC 101409 TaxID=3058041 RepID=UPI002670DC5C|nr:tetratricopeptide repeat protein [Saccharibacillus sp. CPCC 101409]MDO3408991.1 tetratricopeptide repeat protein [Saccharibacillus sp. CPCC 101409]
MFGFGKKKDKAPKPEAAAEAVLTEERREELLRTAAGKREEAAGASGEPQAKLYEEAGLALHELGDADGAIEAFEQSLQAKKSLGPGYKTLLKLYNQKRARAAQQNDGDALQLYMRKIDGLMQISKDVTRGVR